MRASSRSWTQPESSPSRSRTSAHALEVGHVGEACAALVVGERGQQRAAEAHHAQMLFARLVLMDLIGQMLQLLLHLLGNRQASGERARLRCLVCREQDRPDGVEALARREEQRCSELSGRIAGQLAARRGELARRGAERAVHAAVAIASAGCS